MRILLLDDHPMLRLGVSRFLASLPDMTVVGEADDGIRGLNLALAVEWDVLVLDLSLPTLSGLELLRRLVATGTSGKIVVMSHYPVDPYAARAIQAGASAYVSKASDPGDLVAAIRAVTSGQLWVDGRIEPATARTAAAHDGLTPREYQVLLAMVHGRSNTETAAELDISASTVSNHVARIKEKLNVTTKAAIIQYAHRAGLTE